jgi:hypothetical protein
VCAGPLQSDVSTAALTARTGGGGTVQVGGIARLADGSVDYSRDFFGQPVSMTVSGQLQAEIYACAMTSVYTFGPTFRAENSHTTRSRPLPTNDKTRHGTDTTPHHWRCHGCCRPEERLQGCLEAGLQGYGCADAPPPARGAAGTWRSSG